ncbi:hypothetical protein GIB67_006870 [Kingdonia uniflora]|uniref:Uncharacterized protein n=1 Tax=Kingdonia uniflora TaxID=39325 RepID=A0A7J7L063_9MAGN|nr:hypothetical protein GIB67_006870 [Kingdonia uniflora]
MGKLYKFCLIWFGIIDIRKLPCLFSCFGVVYMILSCIFVCLFVVDDLLPEN